MFQWSGRTCSRWYLLVTLTHIRRMTHPFFSKRREFAGEDDGHGFFQERQVIEFPIQHFLIQQTNQNRETKHDSHNLYSFGGYPTTFSHPGQREKMQNDDCFQNLTSIRQDRTNPHFLTKKRTNQKKTKKNITEILRPSAFPTRRPLLVNTHYVKLSTYLHNRIAEYTSGMFAVWLGVASGCAAAHSGGSDDIRRGGGRRGDRLGQ